MYIYIFFVFLNVCITISLYDKIVVLENTGRDIPKLDQRSIDPIMAPPDPNSIKPLSSPKAQKYVVPWMDIQDQQVLKKQDLYPNS